MTIDRRTFMKIAGAAVGSGIAGCAPPSNIAPIDRSRLETNSRKMYSLEPVEAGTVRVLHITDTHAQLEPVYYREPNVNIGLGAVYGRFPHIVGHKFLRQIGLRSGSLHAHAFTYLDFDEAARTFGPCGGFAHLKALLDQLRDAAGGRKNTLTLDSGDTWQGSGPALWTRGRCMVEAANMLGVDAMVGHWEFTYDHQEVLANIQAFDGAFLSHNIRVREEALLDSGYAEMAEVYGHGLYDEESGRAFSPYMVREINGFKVIVIGQSFPRTANTNPIAHFPDWSFGLREEELQELVYRIHDQEKPDLLLMLSHSGMDVDRKLAGRMRGIDVILGGHTHDAIPVPIKVSNSGGETLVINGGSSGKFVGVLDVALGASGIRKISFSMIPVFANFLDPDPGFSHFINQLGERIYDSRVVESRRLGSHFSASRVGKSYDAIMSEPLANSAVLLYRRGNFMGSWDQVIVNALRQEHDAQIALSPGVRWGTAVPSEAAITMKHVLDQTAITYGETYRRQMTGMQIRAILEGVAENLFVSDPYLQSGGDMVRVGGMDYTIDPTAAFGRRISDVRLDNGLPVDDEKNYTVAGWAQVDGVGEGRLIWDVVADHLRTLKEVGAGKINHPTLKNVDGNPGLADYAGRLI